MSGRRVTTFGKQIKLDGQHLADARDEKAAEAIANALQYTWDFKHANQVDPIWELLLWP